MDFHTNRLRATALGTLIAVVGVTIPTALVVATGPSSPSARTITFTDVALPESAPASEDTDLGFAPRRHEAELNEDLPRLAAKGSAPVATWTGKVPPVVTSRPARDRPLAAKAVVKPKPKPRPTAATASGARARVVQVALAQRGDRYVSGGTGPNTFDCSGLVRYAYQVAGVSSRLGGGHSASAMYAWGKANGLTSRSNPRIGDVVIYGSGSHAGIYIGNGKIVSALNPSQGIRVTGLHALGAPFTTFIHTRI